MSFNHQNVYFDNNEDIQALIFKNTEGKYDGKIVWTEKPNNSLFWSKNNFSTAAQTKIHVATNVIPYWGY